MQTTTKAKPATKAANKPAPATKAATKAPSKAKPKTSFYAALYAAIQAGKMGAKVAAYYKRADVYHASKGTSFPRAKTEAERAQMTEDKAKAIIIRAESGTLASGHADGQALYDLMKSAK